MMVHQIQKNYFINPPSAGLRVSTDPSVYQTNPLYTINQPLLLQWKTNYSAVRLFLEHEGSDGKEQVLQGKNLFSLHAIGDFVNETSRIHKRRFLYLGWSTRFEPLQYIGRFTSILLLYD